MFSFFRSRARKVDDQADQPEVVHQKAVAFAAEQKSWIQKLRAGLARTRERIGSGLGGLF